MTGLSYVRANGPGALDARPPVILAAASEAARQRGARTIEAAGFRVATLPLDGTLDAALDRLALQASASALWIELDAGTGADFDRLLDRANAEAAAGRFPAIVAAPAVLLDPLAARLDAADSHLLIDADESARAAALAIATTLHRPGEARLHDITTEPSSARLRQLSDEVGRIAATLARLSSGAAPTIAFPADRPAVADRANAHPVTSDQVRYVIRARRLRTRFFDGELFADPAWDMRFNRSETLIRSKGIRCIPGAASAITHRGPNPSGVNGHTRDQLVVPYRSNDEKLPPRLAHHLHASDTRLGARSGPAATFEMSGCPTARRAPAASRNGRQLDSPRSLSAGADGELLMSAMGGERTLAARRKLDGLLNV